MLAPMQPKIAALAFTWLAATTVPPTGASAIDWIAIGGGADPATSQVSLEQDLRLAREVFGSTGRMHFAGGRNAYGVQVLNATEPPDPLLAELGDVLDPRDGRQATYRKPEIAVDAPATPVTIERDIAAALADGDEPLLLYIAMHGEQGETSADNAVVLWGDYTLSARRLAELLEATPTKRQVRLVVTACYSGGFAELAFAGADSANRAAANRCGLFAAPADDISSGCDPNPDRRGQDAYGLHFLHALRGADRTGEALKRDRVDFDGDGAISLLEAHTRARVASRSFDVPTTTSERWLRHVSREETGAHDGTAALAAFPEESAVIAALTSQLGVADEASARSRLEAAERGLAAAEEALRNAGDDLDDGAADLLIALL